MKVSFVRFFFEKWNQISTIANEKKKEKIITHG